jgi:ribosome-associated protein
MSEPLVVDARVTIPARDLAWTAARAGGPGGQNVNKVSSRVELRFDLAATSALDPATKDRLRAIAKNQLDAGGRLVVRSEKTRDQAKNLEDARAKLRGLVLQALFVPKRRRPTRPTRGSKLRRLDEKARHGQKKRERGGEW